MKLVFGYIEGFHLAFGNDDADRVSARVEHGFYLEALNGCRCTDELDNRLIGRQWSTSPVLRDEGKEAVLDLVPLTGAWREVADMDRESELVGQALQLLLP